jgi:DNA-binding PadR family transcriptional regulator
MLPEMSGLQFLVMSLLFAGTQSGQELRRRLGEAGARLGPSSFSRLMTRMEEANYIQARTEHGPNGGRLVCPRQYEATALGVAMWRRAREFYSSAAGPAADFVAAASDEAALSEMPRAARRAILARRDRRKIKRLIERLVAEHVAGGQWSDKGKGKIKLQDSHNP